MQQLQLLSDKIRLSWYFLYIKLIQLILFLFHAFICDFQEPFKGYYVLTGITGIIEEEMNEYMKKNGVTMMAQPLNVKETLGGMAAVATHVSFLLCHW